MKKNSKFKIDKKKGHHAVDRGRGRPDVFLEPGQDLSSGPARLRGRHLHDARVRHLCSLDRGLDFLPSLRLSSSRLVLCVFFSDFFHLFLFPQLTLVSFEKQTCAGGGAVRFSFSFSLHPSNELHIQGGYQKKCCGPVLDVREDELFV